MSNDNSMNIGEINWRLRDVALFSNVPYSNALLWHVAYFQRNHHLDAKSLHVTGPQRFKAPIQYKDVVLPVPV